MSTTTAAFLHDRLAAMGASLIVQVLAAPPQPQPQPAEGATYAPKLTRDDGRIDWTREAVQIDRQIRAFDPWPGTFTTIQGAVLKILQATPAKGSGAPGTVLDDALTVACGEDALRVTRLQAPGRSAMGADMFLRGHPLPAGTVLGS